MHELTQYSQWLTGSGLNAGAGGVRTSESEVTLDIKATTQPDVVWDFSRIPWPFPDDRFDYVLFKHSIEHVCNWFSAIREGLRVADRVVLVIWDMNAAPFPDHCLQWTLPIAAQRVSDEKLKLLGSGMVDRQSFFVVVAK